SARELAEKRVAQEQNWADWSAKLAESFGFTTLMPNAAKRWSDVAPSQQLADWRSGWEKRVAAFDQAAADERAERGRLQRGEAHWAEQSLDLARAFGFVKTLPDQDSRWTNGEMKTAAWIAELFGKIKASREENEDPSKLEFALPYYIRGREAYFAGDLSAAERHLSRAIAIYPHDARFFYVRAIVRYDIATLSPLAPSEAVPGDESDERASENVTAATGRRVTLPSDSESGTEFTATTARTNATALPRTARRAETAPCDCGTPCPTFVDRRPRHWPALPALTQAQKDERWLDAKSDACQAANLERKKKPKAYLIHEALEKIQGERRNWLEDLRNNPLLCRPAEERQAAAR
ncbi:MAG TPA: hypothetical protein PLV92_22615, partial [Pirellulaceae bacterium]|nr:hypothetical protein [Pirellulaceae bacterium]